MRFLSPDRGVVRRLTAGVAIGAVVALGACSKAGDDSSVAPPSLPDDPRSNPQFSNAAFIFDVNMRKGTVQVKAPTVSLNPSVAKLGNGVIGKQMPAQPFASILSNDVISITTSGFFASAVGAISPNRVRTYFNVSVQNILPGINLITPTFPTPPAGASGVLLIPFSTNVTVTSGGTGTENGNVVVVELPSRGEVQPSPDWNGFGSPDTPVFPALPGAGGEAFNFFNDASCAAAPTTGSGGSPTTDSDCYKWEQFGPIPSGAASPLRRVGFDLEATVGEFRSRLIAIADLAPSSGAVTGDANITVTGTNGRGALQGVTVAIAGAPATVNTSAAGLASFTGLGLGPRAVTISNVPSGCSLTGLVPANGSTVTITSGTPATLTYTVQCTTVSGTVAGSVTRSGTGTQSLAGITVTVTPTGGTGVAASVTGGTSSVSYTAAAVPVGATGAGNVTLGNLPSGCANAGPYPYAGLTDGGTVTLPISISCAAPAARWQYSTRVTDSSTASARTLVVRFDPSTFNSPTIPGADAVGSYTIATGFTGAAASRITAVSTPGATGIWAAPTFNYNAVTRQIGWVTTTTTPGGQNTAQDVATFILTIAPGAAGAVNTATTITEIATPGGDPFPLDFVDPGQNIDITEASFGL